MGDGLGGCEFAGVDLVVYKIVVGDAEVLAGGDAEGECSAGTGVIVTGCDGGEGFGPGGLVGCGVRRSFWRQR